MATQRMSKNEISQQQVEREAKEFVNLLRACHGFFFHGGEFSESVIQKNDRNIIVGMSDYMAARHWYDNTFMPIWRKLNNNRKVDIVRKVGTIKRQYIHHMKNVFQGPFAANIEQHGLCFAAWKEYDEAYSFYQQAIAG